MIGSTVKTIGGIDKAFYWGDKWGCDSVQFYLTLSRKWEVNDMKPDQIELFKESWKESNVKEVVAHIPYLVNLASYDDTVVQKSVQRMISEIGRAKILGVKYLVLHPGSTPEGRDKGFLKIKKSFDNIFKSVDFGDVKILIETMAGQGNALGSRFEEIAELLHLLGKDDLFGVCFDTAHVFQSGYDIRGEGYNEVFEEFERLISIRKIKAFHLNDSKTDCGSRVDRHEHIGKGKVGLDFFKKLLNDKRFKGIPKILETPETEKMSEENLKVLRSLIDKK